MSKKFICEICNKVIGGEAANCKVIIRIFARRKPKLHFHLYCVKEFSTEKLSKVINDNSYVFLR